MRFLLALIFTPKACTGCGQRSRLDLWRDLDSGMCLRCVVEVWAKQERPIR